MATDRRDCAAVPGSQKIEVRKSGNRDAPTAEEVYWVEKKKAKRDDDHHHQGANNGRIGGIEGGFRVGWSERAS